MSGRIRAFPEVSHSAPPAAPAANAPPFVFLNIAVGVLSAFVLLALLADTFWRLPVEESKLLHYADHGLCLFFLIEFAVRFYYAPHKRAFMRWGWLDLVSSIPNLPFLRIGQVLRLVRVVRVLRNFHSARNLEGYFYRNKAAGVFTSVALFSVLMVLFSAFAILHVEQAPTSNIKTAVDALWWAYVTITTVGYGDLYPVTTAGRLIATLLLTTGVGLFGTFTGLVSSWFLAERSNQAA